MGADPSAEEQFGPYLVYERLGVGGMATVHRALERGVEGFERIVALKRLLPHLAADATFIKSFVREAKLASLLNHTNIVHIFECGRVGAQYFITMEYIDGRDIRRILRHARKVSGPPPIHITVGLLLQLCDALDYAHRKTDESGHPLGLVHRDVSPSNLLVTTTGQVKVIDFGIAKAQSAQLRTQTGRVKGKLAYMAPEALAGKELDARSDLFAAGVIGHELLTARPLFATKNDYQTLMKVQRGDVMPPSTFNQSCPPELDAIVLRALARDPDDRFHHARDLRDELHAMRLQYNLQATERDVAAWLGWAFGLAAPSTGAARASKAALDGPPPPNRPSRPRRDDDEAVEIAWGSVDDHNNGEPVVLDDVPDVSEKHFANASALGAEVRLDLDDLADDIPTPVPSHGARASSPEAQSRAFAASLLARPVARARNPTPSLPVREPDRFHKTNIGVGMRAAVMARAPGAPGTQPSLSPPAPRSLPAGTSPPRPTGTSPLPRAETATVVESASPFALLDMAMNHDAPATEPMPFHVDDLALAADTIPSMPAMRSSEPVVRFREPTTPPPVRTPPAPPPIAPNDYPPRLSTPATELFADPELDTLAGGAPAGMTSDDEPSSGAMADEDALPRRTTFGRVVLVIVVLVVVAAAAALVTLYLPRSSDGPVEARPPAPPPPSKPVGTVQLTVMPPGSTITIDDTPTPSGSVELAPGVYQVAIHHKGHKSWLALIDVATGEIEQVSVTLEPLGSVVDADATLIVKSRPPDLEVVLDGTPVGKTPVNLPLPTGPHTIVLRRDGVEVWKKAVDARASAVYEYKPRIVEPAEPAPDAPPPGEPPASEPTPQPQPATTDTVAPETAPGAPPPAPIDSGSATP